MAATPTTPETKEGAANAPDKTAALATTEAPEKGGAAAAAAPSLWKGLIPALAALVLSPLLTLGVVRYMLLPELQRKLNAPIAAETPAPAAPAKGEKAKAGATPPTYEFSNIVVNLAGTMGTRYLKTSFQVTGKEPNLKDIFDENKARLTDVTLNVLSSLTLADLEEPGSKNLLREKLVSAYNQALGRAIVDQVYFADFVVQ